MADSPGAATSTTATTATTGPAEAAGRSGWVLSLAVLVVGIFMVVLDVTIVNVALPTIQNDLGVATEDALWVTTAYTLTLGVVVPLSSWLGDRFGLTRVYIACLTGFAAGSALCGVAWDLPSLIAFRILQALPGGILPVITLSIVYRIVPRERIGAAMGLYGLGIVFAPAAGPVLGGWLVDNYDWPLIFDINVPIGVAGALAASLVLPRVGDRVRRPFDVPGFVAIAYGLFAILLAFSKGEDWGWSSYPVLILIVSGVLSLALFVVIELEVTNPLLDMSVFRYWGFTNSLLLLAVLTAGLLSMLYFLPVFMQLGQGLTALESGLRILPQAIVIGVLMPIAGRLYDKIGARPLAVTGLAIAAYGNYLLHDINPDMTEGDVVLWTCIRSLGMGLAMMPIMTSGIAALPMSKVNEGSALNNVVRQVFGALPLAILTALANIQQAQQVTDRAALLTPSAMREHGMAMPTPTDPDSMVGFYGVVQRTQVDVLGASYGDVFLIVAVLTGVGALLALLLPGKAAAPAPPAPEVAAVGAPTPASVEANGGTPRGAERPAAPAAPRAP